MVVLKFRTNPRRWLSPTAEPARGPCCHDTPRRADSHRARSTPPGTLLGSINRSGGRDASRVDSAPRVRAHCCFRNSGTEYVRDSGAK
jgi:hypothetical protein